MIGIINVQWYDNPGAVLLCYALQRKLDLMGYSNEVIDYASGGRMPIREKKRFPKLKDFLDKLYKLSVIDGHIFYKELRKRHYLYEKFRNNHIRKTYRFTDYNIELLKSYDIYIVGSDIVWKPAILKSKDSNVYFLTCLDKKTKQKKIAYAASVGTADRIILHRLEKEYADRINDFDFISVRENDTADFLKSICNKPIERIFDPVFLLDKDEYIRIMENRNMKIKNYIYFYMLEPNMDAVKYAIHLAQKLSAKILYDVHDKDNLFLKKVLGKYGYACINDGPSEFLSRIYHAQYIVTNSFHGTAFSLIFEKKFVCFSCYSDGVDVSIRMKNLLMEVGLLERFNPDVNIFFAEIDYVQIGLILGIQRRKALDFLTRALECEKNE